MKLLKGMITMLLISLSIFGFSACNSPAYQEITAEQAKEFMDKETNYIILDVRTGDEFNEGHIEKAINIDHEDIVSKAKEMLPDKNQLILVYCRSGRRSKIAAETLVNLGYKNIKEFGGIIDWNYEIVK